MKTPSVFLTSGCRAFWCTGCAVRCRPHSCGGRPSGWARCVWSASACAHNLYMTPAAAVGPGLIRAYSSVRRLKGCELAAHGGCRRGPSPVCNSLGASSNRHEVRDWRPGRPTTRFVCVACRCPGSVFSRGFRTEASGYEDRVEFRGGDLVVTAGNGLNGVSRVMGLRRQAWFLVGGPQRVS